MYIRIEYSPKTILVQEQALQGLGRKTYVSALDLELEGFVL